MLFINLQVAALKSCGCYVTVSVFPTVLAGHCCAATFSFSLLLSIYYCIASHDQLKKKKKRKSEGEAHFKRSLRKTSAGSMKGRPSHLLPCLRLNDLPQPGWDWLLFARLTLRRTSAARNIALSSFQVSNARSEICFPVSKEKKKRNFPKSQPRSG